MSWEQKGYHFIIQTKCLKLLTSDCFLIYVLYVWAFGHPSGDQISLQELKDLTVLTWTFFNHSFIFILVTHLHIHSYLGQFSLANLPTCMFT